MLGYGEDSKTDILRMSKAFRRVPTAGVKAEMLHGPGQGVNGPVEAVEPWRSGALTMGSPPSFTLPGLPFRRPSWTLNCRYSDTLARWLDGCKL